MKRGIENPLSHRRLWVLLPAMVVLTYSLASHGSDRSWETVPPHWEIKYSDLTSVCRLDATPDPDRLMQMGFLRRDGRFLALGMYGNTWLQTRHGEEYEITIELGDGAPWPIKHAGTHLESPRTTGVTAIFHTPTQIERLLAALKSAGEIRWVHKGKTVDRVDLTGSYRAIQSLLACQESMSTQ